MPDKKEIAIQETSLPVAIPPSDTLQLIREMALNPEVDADKLEKLTNLHLRLQDRDREDAYNAAMLRLRPKLPTIKKNGEIDYGKAGKTIKYAKHEDIQKEIEPIYQGEGFFVEYDKTPEGVWMGICKHEAGHKEIKHYDAPVDGSGGKNPIQGMGSTFSYVQRGLLKMIFNLKFTEEDDDGSGGPITHEQAVEIDEYIKKVEMNKERFLKKLKVEDVRDIKTRDYDRALNSLKAKELDNLKKKGETNA